MSLERDRLIADIGLHVPGALPAAIDAELFALERDFYQQTNIWQMEFTLDINTTDLVYTVNPGVGVQCKRLINLWNSTDSERRNWVWPAVMDTPNQILLLKQPSSAATWMADVAVFNIELATSPATRVDPPSWILGEHYDTFLNGVVGRMMLQPLKPYSNPKIGAVRLAAYSAGRARARAETARRHVYGSQTWAVPRAGATYGRQKGV